MTRVLFVVPRDKRNKAIFLKKIQDTMAYHPTKKLNDNCRQEHTFFRGMAAWVGEQRK